MEPYYLHGDKKGSYFYCKKCDLFEDNEHFELHQDNRIFLDLSQKGLKILKANYPNKYFRPLTGSIFET